MVQVLKEYIDTRLTGYGDVTVDYMPDAKTKRDVIALKEWQYTTPDIGGPSGTHYIQVICRRATYAQAKACAFDLFNVLNSGEDETLITLSVEAWCIIRPRRGPVIYSREDNAVSFYFEIALCN